MLPRLIRRAFACLPWTLLAISAVVGFMWVRSVRTGDAIVWNGERTKLALASDEGGINLLRASSQGEATRGWHLDQRANNGRMSLQPGFRMSADGTQIWIRVTDWLFCVVALGASAAMFWLGRRRVQVIRRAEAAPLRN
ncbi:MAG: hypothetical protein JWN40_5996 [Phycisphaerales bacterium]|nr:hypothetical protein [Phycisphaerales bacterium]